MTTKVEFHLRFRQPQRLPRATRSFPQIEQRTGARFDYVPILLGGVFKLTNNRSPMVAVQGRQEQAGLREAGDRALHQEARPRRSSG